MEIPTNVLAAALQCVAKKDARYFLQGIHLEQKTDTVVTVTSTNGHICLRSDVEAQLPDGFQSGVIVEFSKDQSAAIRKKSNWDSQTDIQLALDDSTVTIAGATSGLQLVDAQYPDVSKIWPTNVEPSEDAPAFNPALWETIAKASAALCFQSKYQAMRVAYNGETGAAPVSFPYAEDSRALIMPMRA